MKPRPPRWAHARVLKGHTIVFKVCEKTETSIFLNLMIRDLLQPETRLPMALDSSLGSWISWAKLPYLPSLHPTPPIGHPACWGPFLRNVSHLPHSHLGCLFEMQIPGGPTWGIGSQNLWAKTQILDFSPTARWFFFKLINLFGCVGSLVAAYELLVAACGI